MLGDDDEEGPGLVATAFISFVLLYFVASAVSPFLLAAKAPGNDFSLGDAVATRQGAETSKLKNYRSDFDALSPAKIQKKLRNLPVFYLSTGEGASATMANPNLYLSYAEAEAAAGQSPGATVKATTLDLVYYPLVLGKETAPATTSAAVPEIKNAVQALERRRRDDGGAEGLRPPCVLVPSAAALRDVRDSPAPLGGDGDDDVPLFVVERLAFAGDDGRPRVPLFTERGEGLASYARLREGSSSLPAEPTVRTTTLREVLASMEGGTRPAVDRLEFYGNADDALRADAMASRR